MDDVSFEPEVPDDEREAVARALAELGGRPLPPAVATRLDARLAAELHASPFAARRARRRRMQIGASLSTVAAVAAAVVFALSWGGGAQPPARGGAEALRTAVAATADAPAKTAADATAGAFAQAGPQAKKSCSAASRKDGDRRRAGCPGARGGHARAV